MNRIAEIREQRGLTQAALAHLVGTDVGTISRYERGGGLRLSRAIDVARALGVSLDELVHEPEAATASTARGEVTA